ncbi:MAG: PAS domain-containing protein, partial [Ignavibacteria bacterium]|nr:PAS domain-containing protein [Ignavibacteria bacterium]
MSEISQHKAHKVKQLRLLFYAIMNKDKALETINLNQQLIDQTQASDIIDVVDQLMQENTPIADLKTGINKFINTLGKTIKSYPEIEPPKDHLLWVCMQNNIIIDQKLKALRPKIRDLNQTPYDAKLKQELVVLLTALLPIGKYYTIKETILFPLLEQHWSNYRCLQLMWSFHDDIRTNIKEVINELKNDSIDLQLFNRNIGDLFFTTYAIKLREERILFPFIIETIPNEQLEKLMPESHEFGFPFYNPQLKPAISKEIVAAGLVDLETVSLTAEQLILMMKHLPVDITYVDENNKVCYFSTPAKRIFPRSEVIIGRDVHN